MLLSGVIAGLAFGVAFGRDWHRIERLRIAWLPLLVVAFVARLAAPLFPIALEMTLLGIALTAAFATLNWRLPGALLVALGSLLNMLVIIANGAMPVDVLALQAAGGRMPADALHVPVTNGSLLAFLADIVVVPLIRAAYSIGDVFIAIGGFLVPFVTLTRR